MFLAAEGHVSTNGALGEHTGRTVLQGLGELASLVADMSWGVCRDTKQKHKGHSLNSCCSAQNKGTREIFITFNCQHETQDCPQHCKHTSHLHLQHRDLAHRDDCLACSDPKGFKPHWIKMEACKHMLVVVMACTSHSPTIYSIFCDLVGSADSWHLAKTALEQAKFTWALHLRSGCFADP